MAGCQLVASCDLAVAADDAAFATSGANIGLFCSTPMVALSRNVPRTLAENMMAKDIVAGIGTFARKELMPDRTGRMMYKRPECALAVPMFGAVLNANNTRLDATTIAYILEHGEAKVLLVDTALSEMATGAVALSGRDLLIIDIEAAKGRAVTGSGADP
ncbi:enoyl-CoA hydratase-related protein [Roseobacter ponti]|uniref:enoyl-CoA hydratase-related protein n=1 Tax=Roseobacter ponti TaxID=1891787 RepID=UPI002483AE1B|nr:enoyl-CoA hydratase-related protein [Roseobacter ponti]